jgi:hypothetical protein
MLLGNLRVCEGLCNVTRILVTDMEDNAIEGKIITEGDIKVAMSSSHELPLFVEIFFFFSI